MLNDQFSVLAEKISKQMNYRIFGNYRCKLLFSCQLHFPGNKVMKNTHLHYLIHFIHYPISPSLYFFLTSNLSYA